ncbi:glutathione S-transferase family protein [Phaeospirillum tilakii]|uniref:Glutathione S-transferase family protein n=1 Tax=Phaeospirillum tilakii TaxID=741673 RepID=A0ABW5CAQ4_9PROT
MGLTLVIGTKRFSSWSLRPWLALKATGARFEEVEIALRQPETKAEIRKWSPAGKVPVLIEGGLTVWDSIAICEYLAERFPQAGLWPDAAAARAVARAVSAEMHAGFPVLRQRCPMDLLLDAPLTEFPDDLAAEIRRLDALWVECRTRFGGDGPFLFGRFTIADAMYAPVVTRCATYHLPLSPEAAAYRDAVLAWPALQAWRAASR